MPRQPPAEQAALRLGARLGAVVLATVASSVVGERGEESAAGRRAGLRLSDAVIQKDLQERKAVMLSESLSMTNEELVKAVRDLDHLLHATEDDANATVEQNVSSGQGAFSGQNTSSGQGVSSGQNVSLDLDDGSRWWVYGSRRRRSAEAAFAASPAMDPAPLGLPQESPLGLAPDPGGAAAAEGSSSAVVPADAAEDVGEDRMDTLMNCKISPGTAPGEALNDLKDCTRKLKRAAERTMDAHKASTLANKAYVQMYRHLMNMVNRLRAVDQVRAAFRDDHARVRSYLLKKAHGVKESLDMLTHVDR